MDTPTGRPLSLTRAQLQGWYREAMLRRITELRGLRDRIREGDPTAFDAVRSVGQALRGSGATFGYPDLTVVAALVETAADSDVPRRLEGLVTELRALRAVDDPAEASGAPEWLARAAGIAPDDEALRGASDLVAVWAAATRVSGLDEGELARRVADAFGLEAAGPLEATPSALRLVPDKLMRDADVLPLRETATTIFVATADPTRLRVEHELIALTGRTPVLVVAPPAAVRSAVAGALGGEPAARHDEAIVASPGGDALAAPRVARAGGVPNVLVVDDDESVRVLASTLLGKRGYEVAEACDGVEAIELMRTGGPFDLVLVDLDMPRMDGLEFIWALRNTPEWAHVPAIVITGERDQQLEVSMIEEGADDYIRKPLDPRLLLARVRATIRRAED